MKNYSRKTVQELNRLSSLVLERGREKKLKELYTLFNSWHKKKISDKEMETAVKGYVPVNEMVDRKQYLDSSDPGLPVVEGLLNGIISEKDVPEFVLKELDTLKKVVEL